MRTQTSIGVVIFTVDSMIQRHWCGGAVERLVKTRRAVRSRNTRCKMKSMTKMMTSKITMVRRTSRI